MFIEALLAAIGGSTNVEVEEGDWTPSDEGASIPVQMQDYDIMVAYPYNMNQELEKTIYYSFTVLGHIEFKSYSRQAWTSLDNWVESWGIYSLLSNISSGSGAGLQTSGSRGTLAASNAGIAEGSWHYTAIKL